MEFQKDKFIEELRSFEPFKWGFDEQLEKRWMIVKTPLGKTIRLIEPAGEMVYDPGDKKQLELVASCITEISRPKGKETETINCNQMPAEHVYNIIKGWIAPELAPMVTGYYWFVKEVTYPNEFQFQREPSRTTEVS